MRLKTCAACARAIAESAASCEYCGHCDAEMLPEPVFDEAEFEELFDALSAPIAAAVETGNTSAVEDNDLVTEFTAAVEQDPAHDPASAVSYSVDPDEPPPGIINSPDVTELPDFLAAVEDVPASASADPAGAAFERLPVAPVPPQMPHTVVDTGSDVAEPYPPDSLAAFEDGPAAAPAEPVGAPFDRMPGLPVPLEAARAKISAREIATGLLGIAAGGVLIFALLSAGGSASPEANAAAPATKAAPPPAAAPVRTPKWAGNRAAWVGAERNAMAFELAATNKVGVWMRQVHPRLVVRCRASRVEVFVFTDSPAKMEPQDGDHTVEIQFDESGAVTERWPDSAEHDALFAPDGAAFLERLVRAQRLRFGFSPHNSSPVTIDFEVAGLDAHLATAARQCGWKKR